MLSQASIRGKFWALAPIALLAACSTGNPSVTTAFSSIPSAPKQLSTNGRAPSTPGSAAMLMFPRNFSPNARRPQWMKSPPPGTVAKLAAAQFGAAEVLWFKELDRNNAPPENCEPATAANGIGIDRDGNLWIPNGQGDTTTEYAPNCGAAKLTIADATGEPADVAFDKSGHVYILNLNDKNGPATVNVYDYSGKHLRTLADPSFDVLFGVRSDTNGNVFVSNLTSANVGNVVEFKGGKMPGTQLKGPQLGLPGAPALDTAGNLIIADWLNMTIDVFPPPYKSSPKTFTLMGQSIWCPLGRDERRLFCGDAQNGAIDVYDYPSGKYLYSYTSGLSANNLVTGVAPYPTAPY